MKWRLLFCLFVLAGLSSCKDYPEESINDWTHLKDFPGAARASASTFVVGDKAYVCLGRAAWKADFLKDLWEYDSQTDTWTRKTDFPGVPRVKAVAGVIGTKAYVGMGAIGPYASTNLYSDFWEYDTQTDTWTQRKSFPGSGKNDLFSAVVNGSLYVTLGYDGVKIIRETWKYEPSTDTWTQLEKAPYGANNMAGFTLGNSFYVGSGFNGYNLDCFYEYNTVSQKWSKRADLPAARILSNGMAINSKGYVLLGRYWNGALNGGRLLSDIVEYDPTDNSWTKRGDFPGGARQNAVVFTIGGKGYVAMGEDDVECKRDVWMFRP